MKKNILFSIALLTTGLLSAQVYDTVNLGSGITNQGYYSLLNGIQQNVTNSDWDIAFQTSSIQSTSILINHANGTELYLYPKDTTDWASLDTAGFDTWTQLYNSDTSWEYGAFVPTKVHPNYGWGVYNSTTHDVIGNKLFVIKLSNGDFQKVWIESLSGGVYTFRHAALDNSTENVHTFDMADFVGKNFGYFSFQTHSQIDKEPLATDWDLYFGKFLSIIPVPAPTPYTVTGVLHSLKTKSSKAYPINDPSTYGDWKASPMMNEINTIGFDWKNYDMQNNQYEVADSTVYFVKTQHGDVFKLVFTQYGWDANTFTATGEIVFSKEQIHYSSVEEKSSISFFGIYPNPASDMLTVAYLAQEQVQLEIADLTGKIVLRTIIPKNSLTHSISISNLDQGLYVVILTTHDERLTNKLFVR